MVSGEAVWLLLVLTYYVLEWLAWVNVLACEWVCWVWCEWEDPLRETHCISHWAISLMIIVHTHAHTPRPSRPTPTPTPPHAPTQAHAHVNVKFLHPYTYDFYANTNIHTQVRTHLHVNSAPTHIHTHPGLQQTYIFTMLASSRSVLNVVCRYSSDLFETGWLLHAFHAHPHI